MLSPKLPGAPQADSVGFIKDKPDLTRIYDLRLLNDVLREKGLAEVK